MSNIIKKLSAVQTELKAPKGQFNSFGKYKFRSCEDILEAVKPVLSKHKASITISDDVLLIGERYYIRATARFYDTESDADPIVNTAYAREAQEKKGMDDSQISGMASSYARKYCISGLLLIDDTKDADTNEVHEQTSKADQASSAPGYPSRRVMLNAVYRKYPRGTSVYDAMIAAVGVKDIEDAAQEQLIAVYNKATKK